MQMNFFLSYLLWASIIGCFHISSTKLQSAPSKLTMETGASRIEEYIPVIKEKNIALVVNQTSTVGSQHLVDTLLQLGIKIKKIFAPEHGFRGEADAGEEISTGMDPKTRVPIISLYGNQYKPTEENLSGIDLVVYDIQDVGVRFYTYISTLHYLMEACAENKVPLLILDRPNPNGFYVDGPVMEPAFSSFIGVDPIPVVYGMTPAEYANMVNGEKWLKDGVRCDLKYILCKEYTHDSLYSLPINPSPNLRSMTAIHLYPSICFLEGTAVSVGRGTDKPFMLVGYPDFKNGNADFTPKSLPGAKNPPYLNEMCMGYDLSGLNRGFFLENRRLMLHWIVDFYTSYPEKEKFFTQYFDKLAGTDSLRKQIEKGASEMEIRRSWEPGLETFKSIRKKYLLYKDFE
ncbi:MAG: DUF1343 domain-containing protein [Chitinophagales bacterium]|nr:DUF1343 domain-containing protein [Chitinophagales bacterium]